MTGLEVSIDRDLVGWLSHEGESNRFAFEYAAHWKSRETAFPISPRIPLEPSPGTTAEAHSAQVRQFFENLLPEGQALDDAAQANGISKSNLVGLMIALGKETAGALRISIASEAAASEQPADGGEADRSHDDESRLRPISREELSQRMRERPTLPFSVWDGKVRLSIAGYQDKIAVFERDGQWFLVEGRDMASTMIVKPEPARPELARLPGNEFMCMLLAAKAGLSVAQTRLECVPEHVLFVRRFDRREVGLRVERLHVIDGCQALGLSVGMKYERPYGDQPEVKNIRDGVTYAKLFGLTAQSPQPAKDRLDLLRWVIFQVLIGNTDAHGKNVSFHCGVDGLRLAPAYDLVCIPALLDDRLNHSYAMAVGDAFTESEITPFEWAGFAKSCGLSRSLVSSQLKRMAARVLDELRSAAEAALGAGVPHATTEAVIEVVEPVCRRQIDMARELLKIRDGDV